MDSRKQAIITALRAFIKQRPGLEFGNYGDRTSYNSELRSIARDKRDAERLLDAVENIDDITADDLIAAASSAFSGRLEMKVEPTHNWDKPEDGWRCRLDYCTGQYWPTEYRKAVAAVCAAALWADQRERMDNVEHKTEVRGSGVGPFYRESETTVYKSGNGKFLNAGDWLRTSFRHWFGRSIQQRWFN
jgi:hypothetical protein